MLQQIPQVKSPVRRIAQLDKRVQIRERTDTQQPDGTIRTHWTTIATVWADINVVYARQVPRAAKTFTETQVIIVMKYRPGITSQMQILYGSVGDDELPTPGSHAYDIQGPDDISGRRNKYMELWCLELT